MDMLQEKKKCRVKGWKKGSKDGVSRKDGDKRGEKGNSIPVSPELLSGCVTKTYYTSHPLLPYPIDRVADIVCFLLPGAIIIGLMVLAGYSGSL